MVKTLFQTKEVQIKILILGTYQLNINIKSKSHLLSTYFVDFFYSLSTSLRIGPNDSFVAS
jgi:hypothetical protein